MDVLGEFFRVLQEAGEQPVDGGRMLRDCQAAVAEIEAAREARWLRHAGQREQARAAYEAASLRRAVELGGPVPVQVAAGGWWGEPRPVEVW
jgi:hypothetical protein